MCSTTGLSLLAGCRGGVRGAFTRAGYARPSRLRPRCTRTCQLRGHKPPGTAPAADMSLCLSPQARCDGGCAPYTT
eukprot:scaffold479_cov376-Prasinococcus_capsulatus_cf.AAC.11